MNNMGISRPVIRQIRFPATSRFHQQFIRPLQADTSSSHVLSQIAEETGNFKVLSASALSDLAPEILRPASTPTGTAYIENGWGEKRFRFYMEVELDKTPYATRYAMITGFTSHGEIQSFGGHIDPHMRIYFNSIVVYTDNSVRNNITGGMSLNRSVMTNSQIIQPITTPAMTSHGCRLRAHDVAANLASRTMEEDAGIVINTIGEQSSVATANRDRLLPSVYLANVLGSSISAIKSSSMEDNMIDSGYDSYYKELIGGLKDHGFHKNRFTSMIMSRTQYATSGFIEWQELCGLFPEASDVARIELPAPGTQLTDYINHTEHHKGFGVENQALAIMQNMLPSVMSMFMIQHATFTLTNETHDGQPSVILDKLVPMSEKIDPRIMVNAFLTQVKSQIAPAVSAGNMMRYNIVISCNVLTEMLMKVRMNGSHNVEFAVPLYADSTYTAFGYGTRKDLDELTSELSNLTNAVESMLDPSGQILGRDGYDDPLAAPQAKSMDNFNSFLHDPLQANDPLTSTLTTGGGVSLDYDPLTGTQ